MSFSATKIIALLLLLCLSLNFSNLALANIYDSIEYNLNLMQIKDAVLKVEMIVRGKFKDQLILDLPSRWASASYVEQIKNIQVNPKFSLELKQENHNSQAIIGLPKPSPQSLKITYEIHQKAGNPSDVHEAIVRHDLVHAPGYGILATPFDLKENEQIKVTIKWVNLDSKWKTLASHSAKSNISGQFTAPELLHALYVAGKIRLYNIGTDARPIFLSLYGGFDMQDQKIKSDLAEIIHNQRVFFNDFDFPYYAISLIEGDNPSSMGGTRLATSFTAFLPRGMHQNDYYILFAHEHLHNWIGGKIRNNQDEELNYWWTEGFTDLYCRLLAFRSKSIDRKAFIDEINLILRAYYLSPVNQEPNLRIKQDFWHDDAIQKLPYHRGLVFGLYLNNLIQEKAPTSSLDAIMHDLFQVANKQQFSSSLFQDIARKYVKNGIASEMQKFIERGDIISLASINLPIEKIAMGSYYLGFNRDILMQNSSIQAIDIQSNAYTAGLRNGQKIIAWDFPKGKGDPEQIVTLETTAGTFQFKPEHYNKITIYQLKTALSAPEEKQFNNFFGIK